METNHGHGYRDSGRAWSIKLDFARFPAGVSRSGVRARLPSWRFSILTFSGGSFTSRRLAWWLLWASLAVHVPIAVVAAVHGRVPVTDSDFDNYYDIGTRTGRPYVDFAVEFPVATAQTFRALAPMAGNRQRFGIILVLVSLAADLAIAGALGWGWGVAAAASYALVVIPLLDLFLLRFDLWPTALAAIGPLNGAGSAVCWLRRCSSSAPRSSCGR